VVAFIPQALAAREKRNASLSQQLAVQQEAVEKKERAIEEADSALREQEERASGEEKRLGQLVRTTRFFYFNFDFTFLISPRRRPHRLPRFSPLLEAHV
jgi:hypothetical protein